MELGPLDHRRAFFVNAACAHYAAERVITVDGEHVGWLCPDCNSALAPDWNRGISGYWEEEAALLANANAGASLIAAGFDPAAAIAAVRMTGHLPEECPARVEVTSMSDAEPEYVHGCREA